MFRHLSKNRSIAHKLMQFGLAILLSVGIVLSTSPTAYGWGVQQNETDCSQPLNKTTKYPSVDWEKEKYNQPTTTTTKKATTTTTTTATTTTTTTTAEQTSENQEPSSTESTPSATDAQPSQSETTPSETTQQPADNTGVDTASGPVYPSRQEVSAQAYLVVDLGSGQELVSENADLPLSMAAFVRLMTLKTVLDSPDYSPTRTVTIPSSDRPEETFFAGEQVSTETAIFAMLFADSADAAEALANTYGPGQEAFVAEMNRKAGELGMNSVSFNDATGESTGTLITAKELAILIQSLRKHPEYSEIYRRQTYLIPQSNLRTATNMSVIDNPARVLDSMSSPYLHFLEGLMVTANADNWSYGIAEAVTTDDREVLAIVLGASANNEDISGNAKALYALRAMLEDSAIGAGANPQAKSLLAKTDVVKESSEPEASQAVETTRIPEETMTQTSLVQTTTEAPTEVEVKKSPRHFIKILMYSLGGLLALAIIFLIIALIRQRNIEKREITAVRRPGQPRPRQGRPGPRHPESPNRRGQKRPNRPQPRPRDLD